MNHFFKKYIKTVLKALVATTLAAEILGCSSLSLSDGRDDFSDSNKSSALHAKEVSPKELKAAAKESPKVAIILGPGGYKAFAHTGVIKELLRKNIPIHKIIGVEWGALVAGLYAHHGQINEVEWKLYKLEKSDLNSSNFFGVKKLTNSVKVLDSFLKENLEAIDVSRSIVPFSCPSLNVDKSSLHFQLSGPLYKVVENCLAYPPLLTSESSFVAGVFGLEDAVRNLKANGFNIIIFVNVLGDDALFDNATLKTELATRVLWSEVRREVWKTKSMVTDVIDVDTRATKITDFESRKAMAATSEVAGAEAANRLMNKYGF
ncbi:MAG: patatin-like phospholipase family protein [Bdellovibrionales bacterium]